MSGDPGNLYLPVAIGFATFCVGGLARTYMNVRLNKHLWRGQRGNRSTERRYLNLVREKAAPIWPLIMGPTLMLLGIAIVFGAIIHHNRLQLR
jgi:hypothetical protein